MWFDRDGLCAFAALAGNNRSRPRGALWAVCVVRCDAMRCDAMAVAGCGPGIDSWLDTVHKVRYTERDFGS